MIHICEELRDCQRLAGWHIILLTHLCIFQSIHDVLDFIWLYLTVLVRVICQKHHCNRLFKFALASDIQSINEQGLNLINQIISLPRDTLKPDKLVAKRNLCFHKLYTVWAYVFRDQKDLLSITKIKLHVMNTMLTVPFSCEGRNIRKFDLLPLHFALVIRISLVAMLAHCLVADFQLQAGQFGNTLLSLHRYTSLVHHFWAHNIFI